PVRCIPEDGYLAQRIVFDRRAPSTAMRKMVQTLRKGDVVSITAGAWEGSDLAEAPLLGGRLSVAVGAPRLAALTGCGLLTVFSTHELAKGFRPVLEPAIELVGGGTTDELGAQAAAQYLRRHEPWIRQFPDQWRGWKEWKRG